MAVELRPFGVACNIGCRYCYQNPQREAGNYRQTYDMARMRAAVEREGGPFTLFGGEPLLMPLDALEDLLRWGFETYGGSGIQTNGVLMGDEHLGLFVRYNVDIGVSIDGPGELNDLRWDVTLERTRRSTELTQRNIARLCREHRPPGLIVTLHRLNATAEALPRMYDWMRELDALGIRSVRLHALEIDSPAMRAYGLTDEDNARAFLGFAALQGELANLRFDVVDEIERSLMGRDANTSCVWRGCDPYTTEAVRGVEGNGQSSNCGRTNKDGVDFIKADQTGFERYLALYQTPQEEGGCKGCRFFLMCRGQCPGTAIDGDWRNRSELCGLWKRLFIHVEKALIVRNEVPLSIHAVRPRLERQLVTLWTRGHNATTQRLSWHEPPASAEGDAFALPPFTRRAFVGEAQRAVWEPRLAAIAAAAAAARAGTAAQGIPECCRRAAAAMRSDGVLDPVWRTAAAGGPPVECIEIPSSPATNFLLRPLGIDLLGYVPCSFSCRESRERGEALLACAREAGIEAVDWLEAILDWPVEWSALHGIAEIKTAVVKLIYATDYTPAKVTVRYRGRALAAEAARGLTFAFREPRRRSLTLAADEGRS
jgi:uncharacterized protein